MDKNRFQEYLSDRYIKETNWYDLRSVQNKRLYLIFQWAAVTLSAVIPVLTVTLTGAYVWLTAGLGVLLAISTASLKTFKYQENWINYRTISETLKKERYFYDAKLVDYGTTQDPEALFVERVEAVISRENSLWVTVQRKHDEAGRKDTS